MKYYKLIIIIGLMFFIYNGCASMAQKFFPGLGMPEAKNDTFINDESTTIQLDMEKTNYVDHNEGDTQQIDLTPEATQPDSFTSSLEQEAPDINTSIDIDNNDINTINNGPVLKGRVIGDESPKEQFDQPVLSKSDQKGGIVSDYEIDEYKRDLEQEFVPLKSGAKGSVVEDEFPVEKEQKQLQQPFFSKFANEDKIQTVCDGDNIVKHWHNLRNVVVVSDSLNIRKNYGNNQAVIGKAIRCDQLEVVDKRVERLKNKNRYKTRGWLKIKTKSGLVGWVASWHTRHIED